MDPQQKLFTELLLQLKKTEYDVHDTFLPPEDTPYPFIYLADNQQSDRQTKGAVIGSVYQTIHVWHNNPRQRGTVSRMLLDIKKICYGLEYAAGTGWMVANVTQRILPDNTTKTALLHGLLEVEFKFS